MSNRDANAYLVHISTCPLPVSVISLTLLDIPLLTFEALLRYQWHSSFNCDIPWYHPECYPALTQGPPHYRCPLCWAVSHFHC